MWQVNQESAGGLDALKREIARLKVPLTLTHSHTLSHSHTHTLTLAHTHTLSLSLTHPHTQAALAEKTAGEPHGEGLEGGEVPGDGTGDVSGEVVPNQAQVPTPFTLNAQRG